MATTLLTVANNAESTLDGGINNSVTTLDVADGSVFPSTFPFHITIDTEIIAVGARAGNTLSSLTRAQQGTAAAAHNDGRPVQLRITAQHLSDLNTAVNTIEAVVTGGEVILADNKAIKLGTGTDATIQYDGSDLLINPRAAGSGTTKFTAGGIDVTGNIVVSGTVDGVDIAAHAASASAHHSRYTDAESIAAVEGEATLALTGDVSVATSKSLAVDTINESTAGTGVTINLDNGGIWDTDADTGIQVEEGDDDDDTIRFDAGGSQHAKLDSSAFYVRRWGTAAFSANVILQHARGGEGSEAKAESGDHLGAIWGGGWEDGGTFELGGRIVAQATEAWDNAGHGMSWKFYTVAVGDTTSGGVLRMTINHDGTVNIVNTLEVDTINEDTASAGVTIDGHLLIDDGTTKTHRWDTGDEQSFNTSTNTYTITIATLDAIVGTATGLAINYVPVNIQKQLHLMNVNQVVDTLEESYFIHVDTELTLEGTYQSGPFGTNGTAIQVLNFEATVIFGDAGMPFGSGALFNSAPTITQPADEANTWGPIFAFVSQPTFQADTQTLAGLRGIDFLTSPSFLVVNGGDITYTQYDHFRAAVALIDTDATVTTRIGFAYLAVTTLNGTLTNQVGVDIEHLTDAATINVGVRNASTTVYTPPAAQSITAAATAIAPTSTVFEITSDGNYTLTATPTIANGQDGQVVTIINVGANTVTLQDQGTLANSNLRLGAATRALAPRDNIELLYDSAVGDWVELRYNNVI
jgi:hypothetical protein